jgi:hypothetical protein
MTLLSILLYLLPILLGILVVHLVWNPSDQKIFLLKIALGIGIGMGFTSLLYFVSLLTYPSGFLLYVLLALSLLGFLTLRRWQPLPVLQRPLLTRLQKLLLLVLAIVILLDLATFLSISLRRPHGAWDSWAIWNRAARFIYRGGEDWQRVFSDEFFWLFHADYPPLVPLTNAWAWDILNNETLRVPMIQSGIYLFGSGLLLFSALAAFRSVGTASLATIVLMALPAFVGLGSSQIADTPLAMFIAATAILFCLYSKYQQPQIMALAGMTTAFAAWTKNEGTIFLASSLIGLMVLSYKDRQAWQLAAWYAAGLALPLLLVVFFRVGLAPPGDLFGTGWIEIWQRATDFSRYVITLRAFVAAFFHFGGWGYGAGYSILSFLLYYLIWRREDTGIWSRGLLAVLVMLVIQLFGYFAAYIITPHDLEWHLAFSLDRILLHLYPMLLFVLFSITDDPENIFLSKHVRAHGITTG